MILLCFIVECVGLVVFLGSLLSRCVCLCVCLSVCVILTDGCVLCIENMKVVMELPFFF